MIRYFCDHCGQENTGDRYRLERVRPGSKTAQVVGDHLHRGCFQQLKSQELEAGNTVLWCTQRSGYRRQSPEGG